MDRLKAALLCVIDSKAQFGYSCGSQDASITFNLQCLITLFVSLSLSIFSLSGVNFNPNHPPILITFVCPVARIALENGKAEVTRNAMRARLLARYMIPSRGICFVAPHCFGQEIDTGLRPGCSAARYLRYLPATEPPLSLSLSLENGNLTWNFNPPICAIFPNDMPVSRYSRKTCAITRRDRFHFYLSHIEN